PLERFLCRSDREEAAQSFPAGLERAVLRDGWLQFGVQVLLSCGHARRNDARNSTDFGPVHGLRRNIGQRPPEDWSAELCVRLDTARHASARRKGICPSICGGSADTEGRWL